MKKLSLFMSLCVLSGCSILGTVELPSIYILRGTCLKPAHTLSVPLAIDTPTCEPSLDTPQIAINPSPYQRSYLADGQWPDRLSKVLQQAFVASYSSRWGGEYVSQMGAGLQTTYVLQADVHDFSVYDLGKPFPKVRLKILMKIVDLRNRTVLAAHPFCETTPVRSLRMGEVVEAFNKALHSLIAKSIPWMEGTFAQREVLQTRQKEEEARKSLSSSR